MRNFVFGDADDAKILGGGQRVEGPEQIDGYWAEFIYGR